MHIRALGVKTIPLAGCDRSTANVFNSLNSFNSFNSFNSTTIPTASLSVTYSPSKTRGGQGALTLCVCTGARTRDKKFFVEKSYTSYTFRANVLIITSHNECRMGVG